MKKTIYSLVGLLWLLSSCTSSHVNAKRINQAAFPVGFNDPGYILLIQERTSGLNHRGMNNYLRKAFRKHYTGKFEMASLDEINNEPKYRDKKLYRFVLTDHTWTSSATTRTTTSSGTSFEYANAYLLDFFLHDRMEDKTYPSIGISSNVPAKAMNRVAVTLDKQLHK